MKSRFMILATITAVIVVVLGRAPARADMSLYGVTYFDDQLVKINAATGFGSLVGSIDPSITPFGLATREGQLFTFNASNDLVTQIHPTDGSTGATYNVGLSGIVGQGGLAFNGAGTGFLTSALDASFNPVNDLYSFDITTGKSSLLGSTSVAMSGIAFGPNGTLYGLGKEDGNLYSINTMNATTTLIGNIAPSPGSPIGALTFAPDGTLFASINDQLYTVSTATGLGTLVDPTPGDYIGYNSVSGISYSAVPEPSSVALMAMGVVGLGLLARRRAASRRLAG